jgi:hypothetical protein
MNADKNIILILITIVYFFSSCSRSLKQSELAKKPLVIETQQKPMSDVEIDTTLIIQPSYSWPIFPGGQDSLINFIENNLRWTLTDSCGEGVVLAEILVDRSGSIINTKIVNGICEYYDNEALRIIEMMPDWIPPTKESDRILLSKIQIPFKFFR